MAQGAGNGIYETIETYFPNDFKTISEDINENCYPKITKTYKSDILLIESLSPKGICGYSHNTLFNSVNLLAPPRWST